MNLARLNHILIPPTKQGRDRLRRGVVGKLSWPVWWFYSALSSEGRVLAVATLVLGAAALDIYGTRLYLLWAALCGLLVAALLARQAFRLDGVRLEVRMPARLTVGAPASCEVIVHNEGHRPHGGLRLLSPFLPWDGRWLDTPPGVAALPVGGRARLVARATFSDRGEHHLDSFALCALVPLGLAVGPARQSEGIRFRVVPRIALVAALQASPCSRYQPGGVSRASFLGESRELHGVRPYRRGDPVRDLHALTWARTGAPHVREYQQEYYRRVAVLLDVDSTVVTERGLEAMLSLAAGLVARLVADDALVDLVVGSAATPPLTIGRSIGSLERALDELALVRRGPRLDVGTLRERLAPLGGQLSGLYFITEQPVFGAESTLADRLWPGRRARRARAAAVRREWLAELGQSGLCAKVLRVARRPSGPAEPHEEEQSVSLTAIERQEPLSL